jgi:hypothetical protein
VYAKVYPDELRPMDGWTSTWDALLGSLRLGFATWYTRFASPGGPGALILAEAARAPRTVVNVRQVNTAARDLPVAECWNEGGGQDVVVVGSTPARPNDHWALLVAVGMCRSEVDR